MCTASKSPTRPMLVGRLGAVVVSTILASAAHADSTAARAARCAYGDTSLGRSEVCNDMDDDCDTLVDEDWPALGKSCVVGLGACMARGVYVCASNGMDIDCSVAPARPSQEICGNQVDEDCDGVLDNGCTSLGPDGHGETTVDATTVDRGEHTSSEIDQWAVLACGGFLVGVFLIVGRSPGKRR
ncbi:hypothetical protein ACFL6C_11295 [Myxococcota bacterium]